MNDTWTDALGTSDIFLDFQERVALLAGSERPILVLGERGTGKELAVQRLHYQSPRWDKPLVTVLCPALSPTLLESELFGHEAGAFTGARSRRSGFFERADSGTLFLDEVADMPLPLQDKLLRVLEYGTFERVGGWSPVRVDVRVVAATNRDLRVCVARGLFRADLLDRLAFDVLHVPPLRVRGEDRLLLARHFAGAMAVELGVTSDGEDRGSRSAGAAADVPYFGENALRQLKDYSWPGNVRELKNVVERSVARRRSLRLESLDMDPFVSPYLIPAGEPAQSSFQEPGPDPANPSSAVQDEASSGFLKENFLPEGFSLPRTVDALEREAIHKSLVQAKYRQSKAASLLGLTYHQFRALYRKHQKGV